ncbi:MAG TPA: IS110 family transposase [Thermoanaerobaculia bacterium]|nr:IS110 family transposase [Thermoanaerobaculia bacterium]
MSHDSTTYVGLDVHKASIAVAVFRPGSSQAEVWEMAHEEAGVRRLARKLLRAAPGRVECAYEAGCCGYALQRRLIQEGVACRVVAPSLVPVKPGARIKTDRRDAVKLAESLRADTLTEVHPPTPAEEALRDLVRCRETAREDLLRCRHRLSKMLLRRGLAAPGRSRWTQAHHRWLRTMVFEHLAEQRAFESYLLAMDQAEARLKQLDHQLEEVAQQAPHAERVAWLRCFRGIATLTAIGVLAELHGFERFGSPRKLMSYLGLVPGEHSSGEKHRRGGITKAGNRHVRRLLIEAAWHARLRPVISEALKKRREGQPAAVIALADRAQQRLSARYYRLVIGRGKPPTTVAVAVARELAGFLWAVLRLAPSA